MPKLHQNQKSEIPMLPLPAELPVPQYQFGQVVQWPGFHGCVHWGIIRGLQYWSPRMSAEIAHSLEWVGWSYLVEVDPDSCKSAGIEDVWEQDLKLREVQPQ
ncbi:hypothetical protein NDA01_28630 [Trichocoleus desertorum AS-A10]|uniref:hypothetical protein n=1 Tax=Trichocoleus desertorum TaxID=1481672 RepID=UPI003298AD85